MNWLSMALASAALLGFYEVSRKQAVEDNAVLPVLFVANLGGLVAFLILLALARSFPHTVGGLSFALEPLSTAAHLQVFLKSCIVTASWVCAYFSVKHLPISIAAPLRSLSPALTVVGALLIFGESPRSTQWWAMVVIFAGYLAFAWLGRAEGIVFSANRWVALLLVGTGIGAMSGLYDKYLLQKVQLSPTTLQLWFTLYNLMLQGGLCMLLWWRTRSEKPFTFRPQVPLVGALLVLADQFYFRALSDQDALVSIVALARRGSVLVSFTLGGLLFRERLLKKKALALLVILAGLVLLLRG